MGSSYDKTRSSLAESTAPVLRPFRAGCEAGKLKLARFLVLGLIIPFICASAIQTASYFATLSKLIDVGHLKKFGKIDNYSINRY